MKSPEFPQNVHPDWRSTLAAASLGIRQQVAAAVLPMAEQLSDLFYVTMMADEQAGKMLNHQLVNQRLHAQMARWLRQLFDTQSQLPDIVAVQVRTGEVHARIGVHIELVLDGARVLKRAITRRLTASPMPRDALAEAIPFVHELIELAMQTMNQAYASNTDRMARSDEAYRLFFLSQNMRAERERQKSQLLEWAQQILVRYYWEAPAEVAPTAAQGFNHSQLGLWLQHKASMLFEDAPELAHIEDHTRTIEEELLPQLSRVRTNHVDARGVVAAITARIDQIKALLGSMFDRYIEVEDGRDSTTNLLNRRYLPSVAQREIALAQRHGSCFAAVLVDIDGFAGLRETLGLEAADLLLSQVAGLLSDQVRAGDFTFRIGDSRFLVLVVETAAAALAPLGEGLRRRVAETRLRTPSHLSTLVTVSLGVAVFDGHPDYQRLVDRATEALQAAQAQGGNRCVVQA